MKNPSGRRSRVQPCIAAVLAMILMCEMTFGDFVLVAGDENTNLVASVAGDRMMLTVDALANFGTRVFYTNSSGLAGIYIHDRLSSLGLWTYYQGINVSGHLVQNVIAVMNGTDDDRPQVLFGAHYDSTSGNLWNSSAAETSVAPGADDDASGVAAVIELATILTGVHLRNTLKFVAWTAEEAGLNGSRYFVEHDRALGVTYSSTAVLDMIGYRAGTYNEAMLFQESSSNTLGVSMLKAVSEFSLAINVTTVTGQDMVYSDHASFWRAGYPSVLVIEPITEKATVNPYYHTAQDTPDHLSSDQMVEATRMVLGGFLMIYGARGSDGYPVTVIIIAMAAIAVVAAVTIFMRGRREPEL